MKWTLTKYPLAATGTGEAAAPYASGAAVAGNLVYLSGMDNADAETGMLAAGDFEAQLAGSLDKIKEALEGRSSLANLVKLYVMLAKVEDYPKLGKALEDYFLKHAPSLIVEPPVITVMPV